jgi:diguanylate cyclase (GGDEF)-like protein
MPQFSSSLDDETLQHLVDALTKSGQAISIYDAEDNLRYANETYQGMFLDDFEGPFTFTEILRYGAKNGIGVRIDDDVEALIARTPPRRRSVPRRSFETDFLDGRWFWIDHTVLPNGWVLTVAADITALKHNEKSLRQAHEAALHASQTDPLTGLPNRRRILELLEEALTAHKATKVDLCVAFIDIDQFKAVNDIYGHEAGDAVLQHFARVCQERLRPQDQLGRIGGEEFLLLLPDTAFNDGKCLVEKLRADFPPAALMGATVELPCSFSAGITQVTREDDQSLVLYRADKAMSLLKRRQG